VYSSQSRTVRKTDYPYAQNGWVFFERFGTPAEKNLFPDLRGRPPPRNGNLFQIPPHLFTQLRSTIVTLLYVPRRICFLFTLRNNLYFHPLDKLASEIVNSHFLAVCQTATQMAHLLFCGFIWHANTIPEGSVSISVCPSSPSHSPPELGPCSPPPSSGRSRIPRTLALVSRRAPHRPLRPRGTIDREPQSPPTKCTMSESSIDGERKGWVHTGFHYIMVICCVFFHMPRPCLSRL